MRKRSKYKPRGVRLDVMNWIRSGMQKAADVSGGTIITQTKIKNHISIEALRKSSANKDDMDAVINAFNVAEALSVKGIGAEYNAEIKAGQDALLSLCNRASNVGRFVCTGPELVAINLAMEVHDAQLDICTVAELESALDYVWQQIRLKKVRKLPAPAE